MDQQVQQRLSSARKPQHKNSYRLSPELRPQQENIRKMNEPDSMTITQQCNIEPETTTDSIDIESRQIRHYTEENTSATHQDKNTEQETTAYCTLKCDASQLHQQKGTQKDKHQEEHQGLKTQKDKHQKVLKIIQRKRSSSDKQL
jgi:hypothetical protein